MPCAIGDIWLYTLWAFLAGVSIPLGTANNAMLNTRSAHPKYQSFYTSLLGIVLGGFAVLPLAFASSSPRKPPTRWWSLLGGLCSLPAFGVLIAAPDLGLQLALLILVVAQLFMTLLLDQFEGRRLLSSPHRVLGLGCVFCGIMINSHSVSEADPHGHRSLLSSVLTVEQDFIRGDVLVRDILFSAVCGIGYTLQSKCNNVLAKDLGSAAAATFVSAIVNLIASLPVAWFLCTFWNLWPRFLLQDWPRFLFAAFQSAFYIACLSVVPSRIGYTAAFMSVQLGSLLISSILDATGALGINVPFTIWRTGGLLFVVAGLWLFSTRNKSDDKDLDDRISLEDSCKGDLEERQGLLSMDRAGLRSGS